MCEFRKVRDTETISVDRGNDRVVIDIYDEFCEDDEAFTLELSVRQYMILRKKMTEANLAYHNRMSLR